MIDVHAHLSDPRLFDNAQTVVDDYLEVGVTAVVCSGWNIKSSFDSKLLAEKYDSVFFSAGIHPSDCAEYSDEVENRLKQLLNADKAVALGEIGLDYHYENIDKTKQKEVFERQIVLADEMRLPIVIHTRNSAFDTLDILKANKSRLNNGILMHCFSESKEIAKELNKFDVYYSFGGVATFKNARNIYEIAADIPLDRILSETDCPYLSPEPFRGKTNEPKNLVYIIRKLAEVFGTDYISMQELTVDNAKRFYKKIR